MCDAALPAFHSPASSALSRHAVIRKQLPDHAILPLKSKGWNSQIPPDLVVKFQPIDIVDVIL
jgi:hypothetical protein